MSRLVSRVAGHNSKYWLVIHIPNRCAVRCSDCGRYHRVGVVISKRYTCNRSPGERRFILICLRCLNRFGWDLTPV